MTWLKVGAVAGTTVAGAVHDSKSRSDAKKADKAAAARLEAGYQDAEQRLSPYLESSEAANRQLMIEMGMGESIRERDLADIASLESQIEALGAPLPIIDATGLIDAPPLVYDSPSPSGAIAGSVGDNISNTIRRELGGSSAGRASSANDAEIAGLQAQLEAKRAQLGGEDAYAPSNAYMQTPGYQAAIDAGTQAVNTGAAGAGALYSGTRGAALRDAGQNIQQSYYSNYMNLLQNMANPTTATNLSNIGIGVAGNIGAQNIATTSAVNEDRGAFIADAAGGLTSAAEAYINRPQTPPPPTIAPATANATDYSRHV
mgnify:CR=1 FL=1